MNLSELHEAARRLHLNPEQVLIVHLDTQMAELSSRARAGGTGTALSPVLANMDNLINLFTLLVGDKKDIEQAATLENRRLVWEEGEGGDDENTH